MAKRKDFDIEIREELSRTVTVKAETLGDAINQVMDQYKLFLMLRTLWEKQ